MDDNTSYAVEDNISSVVKLLRKVASAIFQWIKDNEMNANIDKSHVLLSTSNESTVKINQKQSTGKMNRNHHWQWFKIWRPYK